jgi:hypothetical protein
MHDLLRRLLTELHAGYFKPSGFSKERQRFRRTVDEVMQEVDFQSSQWNSSSGPARFYINISIGFADTPMRDGKSALTGSGRIAGLAAGAPSEFDLTMDSYGAIKEQVLILLPRALSALPQHYDDVRSRARSGLHIPIPLPESWKSNQPPHTTRVFGPSV